MAIMRIDLAKQVVTLTEGNDYTDFLGVSLNSGNGFPPPTQIQINGDIAYDYGAIGDFNRDGHMDLAAATSEVGILLGNGYGTFQNPVYYGAGMVGPIATGDSNNDGKLDIVGASGGNVSVLLGNGDGTFGLPVNFPAGGQLVPLTDVAVADFTRAILQRAGFRQCNRSSATTVTATITTTASGSASTGPTGSWPTGVRFVAWALALGASGLLFAGRRRRVGSAGAIMVVLAFAVIAGCGGSKSSTLPSTGFKGTPAGTYTATVTATSGSLSHQVALTLSVQ
jgi:uncharacterized protein YceK